VLHLPVGVQADVATLLAAPRPTAAGTSGVGFAPCATAASAPAASVVPGSGLHLVGLAAASGLCGHAEVFGRLCDGGCVTATDRPYVVDGVTVVLRPLTLDVRPYMLEGVTRPETHLGSQVAAAYFAAERAAAGSRLSVAGLGGGSWGAGATTLAGDDVVPVGVLGWDGTRITLLDLWTVRRERMEAPARAYWAGRVEQRPWPVFLAQVLQFQSRLTAAPLASVTVPARILVERGFVDLPAAGYLPVDPARDLRAQVQDLMGPGVDLRLCAVRRDQIPHELERAQHMDRISLLRGLADATAREEVDILVPDGTTVESEVEPTGTAFALDVGIGVPGLRETPGLRAVAEAGVLPLRGAGRIGNGPAVDLRLVAGGAARTEVGPLITLINSLLRAQIDAGTAAVQLAGTRFGISSRPAELVADVARAVLARAASIRSAGGPGPAWIGGKPAGRVAAMALSLQVDRDPFALQAQDRAAFELTVEAFQPREEVPPVDLRVEGSLRLGSTSEPVDDGEIVLQLTGLPFLSGVAGDRSVVETIVASRGEHEGTCAPDRIVSASTAASWYFAPRGVRGRRRATDARGRCDRVGAAGRLGGSGGRGRHGDPVREELARAGLEACRPGIRAGDRLELVGSVAGDQMPGLGPASSGLSVDPRGLTSFRGVRDEASLRQGIRQQHGATAVQCRDGAAQLTGVCVRVGGGGGEAQCVAEPADLVRALLLPLDLPGQRGQPMPVGGRRLRPAAVPGRPLAPPQCSGEGLLGCDGEPLLDHTPVDHARLVGVRAVGVVIGPAGQAVGQACEEARSVCGPWRRRAQGGTLLLDRPVQVGGVCGELEALEQVHTQVRPVERGVDRPGRRDRHRLLSERDAAVHVGRRPCEVVAQ
jgi:hypothetical protein